MSEDDNNLGPMPDPMVERPIENPGGADAVNEDTPFAGDDNLARDLHPDDNPGVEDNVPEEIGELDDKPQEPEDDEGEDPKHEDPV
ncbi:hypothetical protein [Nocardioides euryhalodurans]|uniref:Uncharacterized protein n=1 Tax=Nocardioides euryhalodurans TaxID=2518370 RepID=A0A4P7GKV0_9ACTN|nr:hypothetical protein [Nocardioides euryhalodurans]QBR92301.1 hypothetical protein EXE57_08370 [Nocardioides euryhalodurans]